MLHIHIYTPVTGGICGGIYISFNCNYGSIGFPIQLTNVSTSLQPFFTDILCIYPHIYIPVYGGICGGIFISFNYNYGGIGFPIRFTNVSTLLQPFVTDILHM